MLQIINFILFITYTYECDKSKFLGILGAVFSLLSLSGISISYFIKELSPKTSFFKIESENEETTSE